MNDTRPQWLKDMACRCPFYDNENAECCGSGRMTRKRAHEVYVARLGYEPNEYPEKVIDDE